MIPDKQYYTIFDENSRKFAGQFIRDAAINMSYRKSQVASSRASFVIYEGFACPLVTPVTLSPRVFGWATAHGVLISLGELGNP